MPLKEIVKNKKISRDLITKYTDLFINSEDKKLKDGFFNAAIFAKLIDDNFETLNSLSIFLVQFGRLEAVVICNMSLMAKYLMIL